MGQGQSGPTRYKDNILISDSQLEFDPGKKINSDSLSVSSGEYQISVGNHGNFEIDEGLFKSVVDDGGEGYVPASNMSLKKKMTVPVVFRWEYGGKEIYISGSFNNWKSRIPMTYCGGEFTAIVELASGEHEFKYLVDGHWMHDPNQKTSNDTYGGRNNIMVVTESDFDATEALLSDECGSKNLLKQLTSVSASTQSLSRLSPPGSYSNIVPNDKKNVVNSHHSTVPPSLPPHLLNVILNKEGVNEEDPTLLPLPNHVALNHLYALSIKDSVMTMSATHRYKRKYVTTIFYKPIKIN